MVGIESLAEGRRLDEVSDQRIDDLAFGGEGHKPRYIGGQEWTRTTAIIVAAWKERLRHREIRTHLHERFDAPARALRAPTMLTERPERVFGTHRSALEVVPPLVAPADDAVAGETRSR